MSAASSCRKVAAVGSTDGVEDRTVRGWTQRPLKGRRPSCGGVAADSAAWRTLRPKSVPNRENCASWRLAKLAAVDASSASLPVAKLNEVFHTSRI